MGAVDMKEIEDWKHAWDIRIAEICDNNRDMLSNDPWLNGTCYRGRGDQALLEKYLPEPYFGDPLSNSIVMLNLNPGPPIPKLQSTQGGSFIAEIKACGSYQAFAKRFSYLEIHSSEVEEDINGGHKWWTRTRNRLNEMLEIQSDKMPFVLEICPYHSNKFAGLRWGRGQERARFHDVLYADVIRIASIAVLHSSTHCGIAVGKVYEDIFKRLAVMQRMEKIYELNWSNFKQHGFKEWPRRMKDNKIINRSFTIWEEAETKSRFMVTWAPGANTLPANCFDEIIRKFVFD